MHVILHLQTMIRTKTIDKGLMSEEIRVLISEGHSVSITVRGNSMNPLIVDRRDKMTLGPWKDTDLHRGCVAFVRDSRGEYLIHRIIRREGDILTLLGDGNINMTETADVKDVIGIMHSIERKGRTITSDSLLWKAYSWIWMTLEPVRRWPLGLWRKLNPGKVSRPNRHNG